MIELENNCNGRQGQSKVGNLGMIGCCACSSVENADLHSCNMQPNFNITSSPKSPGFVNKSMNPTIYVPISAGDQKDLTL